MNKGYLKPKALESHNKNDQIKQRLSEKEKKIADALVNRVGNTLPKYCLGALVNWFHILQNHIPIILSPPLFILSYFVIGPHFN